MIIFLPGKVHTFEKKMAQQQTYQPWPARVRNQRWRKFPNPIFVEEEEPTPVLDNEMIVALKNGYSKLRMDFCLMLVFVNLAFFIFGIIFLGYCVR